MDDFPQHHAWVNPEKARYYQGHLARDLFGDWTLRKVSGSTGSSRRRIHSTAVGSYDDDIAQVREGRQAPYPAWLPERSGELIGVFAFPFLDFADTRAPFQNRGLSGYRDYPVSVRRLSLM